MKFDLEQCFEVGPGRKAAWDAFVQSTVRIIYAAVQRTMRRWPHDQSDIEDRVQDVYVKLMQDECRLLKTFDSNRASLSTWLTLVARSTTRDYMEKRRIETVSLNANDHVHGAHTAAHMPLLAMDALTDRQRLVLQMLFDEDMTVEQAAARLGVDQQTIRSTKHKALTRLREGLKNEKNK